MTQHPAQGRAALLVVDMHDGDRGLAFSGDAKRQEILDQDGAVSRLRG